MKEEADQLVADREPGDVQFDEESGDGDTIAVERERDLTLSAQAQESVRQIDEALATHRGRHLRHLRHLGRPDPQGATRGHPLGRGAGRAQGRSTRPVLTGAHRSDRQPPEPARPPGPHR